MRRLLLLFTCLLPFAARPAVDFAHTVAPVLMKHCADCHLGDKKKGGLSFNTRASLLEGGENGPVLTPGAADGGRFIAVLRSTDSDERMPPKGPRVPPEQIAALQAWVAAGAPWPDDFSFGAAGYEPPLKPRVVTLPPARDGLTHPIDRLLAAQGWSAPAPVSDSVFLRRAHLDLIGLLPSASETEAFLADRRADKRERLVQSLLDRRRDYAEHWLSFWNDLLRNDYVGTGYIDGGRKQITRWLYGSLLANKPYDVFARELIAPTAASEGFINGIQWRGNVNASQVREIQFSQNVSQVFLGLNMKCASCHDSFTDRWKLNEAYNLAAVFASQPLEIHRCDVATGRFARPAWIFPELGDISPDAPKPERLKQLAALMTHPENGRFTRTLVNRLWQRLFGRGIVDPVDAMDTPPFNADLLDYLAVYFQENGYDMQKTLAHLAASRAYQSPIAKAGAASGGFAGPTPRRLTAEQFLDAVWTVTGTAPTKLDADVKRPGPEAPPVTPAARWIWRTAEGSSSVPVAGERATFRATFTLPRAVDGARAVITCDNEYTLYVNGRKIGADVDWPTVETWTLPRLRAGENEVVIAARNAGHAPNAAALFFEIVLPEDGAATPLASRTEGWTWTDQEPDARGGFGRREITWQPAAEVANQRFLPEPIHTRLAQALGAARRPPVPARASLVKADLLMRALGRPNREQVVSVRPAELSTLEAITLSNGEALAKLLAAGGKDLAGRFEGDAPGLVRWLFLTTLCREPTAAERQALEPAAAGGPAAIEDILWSVLMLPEFQLVL
jgi:hypothetical protein